MKACIHTYRPTGLYVCSVGVCVCVCPRLHHRVSRPRVSACSVSVLCCALVCMVYGVWCMVYVLCSSCMVHGACGTYVLCVVL